MSVDDAFRKLMETGVARQGAPVPVAPALAPSGGALPGAGGGTAVMAASEDAAESEPDKASGAEPLDLSRIRHVPRLAPPLIDSRSQIAEEYRILRTRLQALQLEKPSILLTSCHHREGKTSTALNLALSLAGHPERKILLAGLDLRRPSLSKILNLSKREHDVVSAVRGQCTVEEAICYSEADNLYVLPARREYANGSDYLETAAFRDLLERLHASFDLVIIDSCPCLSTSDAAILGPLVGGVVMVVKCLQTQRESIQYAIDGLQEVGSTMVGVVLTFVKYFLPRYLYRYQYYAGHYYADGYGYGGEEYAANGENGVRDTESVVAPEVPLPAPPVEPAQE